jgi:tetratricopeptide (TPR) repeat protein
MHREARPDHPNTLIIMDKLAQNYQATGRLSDAIPLFQQAITGLTAKFGVDHPDTLIAMNNLAAAWWRAGRTDLSIPIFEKTLKLREAKPSPDHPDTLASLGNLGVNYRHAGRIAEGTGRMEDALKRARKRFGRVPASFAWVQAQLIDAYTRSGESAKLERALRGTVDDARANHGCDDPRTATSMPLLGLNLLTSEKWAEAEPLLRECLAIRQKTQPHDWSTFNSRSMLGHSLLGQGRLIEAEPLILSGYDGLKGRAVKIPAPYRAQRISEAGERVVQLHDRLGLSNRAAAWRRKLGLANLPAELFARP